MIEFKNVTKTFPDGTTAVKELSFTVKEGELCVLLGPSGCGKTTTMKMVNRLVPMSGGGEKATSGAVAKTRDVWQGLNAKVDIEQMEPREVAEDYLKEKGLID